MSRNSNGNGEGPHGPKLPYEVGYGRPPKHGQFKPGQSGNPKGRCKRVESFEDMVVDVLTAEVTIIVNGRRLKMPLSKAILKKLCNQAVAGDKHAQREVIRLMKAYLPDKTQKDASVEKVADEYDFSKFTIEEMELLQDAAMLLEGKQERPPPPLPPGYRWIEGRAVLLNPRTGEPYDEEEK
jgi:hypothetical protein